ncbi:hypothetical protein N9W34_01665 [Rickettsiales bacterium]|nr:hypothetical protein [Rickettsiales bacterium]
MFSIIEEKIFFAEYTLLKDQRDALENFKAALEILNKDPDGKELLEKFIADPDSSIVLLGNSGNKMSDYLESSTARGLFDKNTNRLYLDCINIPSYVAQTAIHELTHYIDILNSRPGENIDEVGDFFRYYTIKHTPNLMKFSNEKYYSFYASLNLPIFSDEDIKKYLLAIEEGFNNIDLFFRFMEENPDFTLGEKPDLAEFNTAESKKIKEILNFIENDYEGREVVTVDFGEKQKRLDVGKNVLQTLITKPDIKVQQKVVLHGRGNLFYIQPDRPLDSFLTSIDAVNSLLGKYKDQGQTYKLIIEAHAHAKERGDKMYEVLFPTMKELDETIYVENSAHIKEEFEKWKKSQTQEKDSDKSKTSWRQKEDARNEEKTIYKQEL